MIDLPGYTIDEKMEIARKHVVPSQMKEHGLMEEEMALESDAISQLILSYTREAGCRELQRKVAAVCRHVAVKVAEKMDSGDDSRPVEQWKIGPDELKTIMGPEEYQRDLLDQVGHPGVAIGLAWTPVGGEALVIEACHMAGTGQLRLTGQLGDVMKESASMSLSWIRAHSHELELEELTKGDFLQKHDIHVHFPAGAVPKDGPSAGVAITMALLSMFWGRNLRQNTAMTGEASLRGLVLPVGGIKEKVIGALRHGIKRVIIPARNAKELVDIPDEIKSQLQIHLVDSLEQVIKLVFVQFPKELDMPLTASL